MVLATILRREHSRPRTNGKYTTIIPEEPEGVQWSDYNPKGSLEEILTEHNKGEEALRQTQHYESSGERTHNPFDLGVRNVGDVIRRTALARTPTEMRVGMIRMTQHSLNGLASGNLAYGQTRKVLQTAGRFLAEYFTQTIDRDHAITALEELASDAALTQVSAKKVEYGFLGDPQFVANSVARLVGHYRENELPDAILGCGNSGTEFTLLLSYFLNLPAMVKKTTRRELNDRVVNGAILKGGKECSDGVEVDVSTDNASLNFEGKTVLVADTQVATGDTMAFAFRLAYSRDARDAYGTTISCRTPRGSDVVKLDAEAPFYRLRSETREHIAGR